MNLTGVYYGCVKQFHDVFDPLLSNLSTMHINHGYENVTAYAWVPSLIQLSEVGTLNTSSPILKDSHDTFFAKSLMVYEDAPLRDEAIQSSLSTLACKVSTLLLCVSSSLTRRPQADNP